MTKQKVEKQCKHKYIIKEIILKKRIVDFWDNETWYDATKTVIFCEKCGDIKLNEIDEC